MAEKKDWLNDSERNIFLTGQAGTGKTYKIREFVENEQAKGHVVLLSATTGTAAVNVGGQTAHALFGIPVPCMGVPITKAPAAQIKVLAKADVVVIDEVSMMRNDAFSFGMRVLKKAERLKGGKIRVVVIGDFSQLPPVVTKNDVKLLKKFGYDESGYPFTTKEWKSLNFKVVELTEIKRQEDVAFAKLLGRVRDEDLSVLPEFDQFVDESYSLYVDEENLVVNPKLLTGDAIVLCGTNAEADAINRAYMDSIDTPVSAYQASTSGRVAAGIVDDVALVKVGCRVMFTANDEKRRFQNGTFGVVERCFKDHVLVRLENDKTVNVYPKENTCYQYKIKGGALTKEKTGTVSQIPLKVAAAVTIHKSQGKTFDRAIVSPSVFAAGQLYVALSRVRSPEGLILTDKIPPNALVDNEIVSKFYQDGYTYEIKKASKKPSSKTQTKKTTTTKKSSSGKTTGRKTSSKSKTTTKKKASSTKKKTTPSKKVASKTKKSTSTSSKKRETSSKKNTGGKVSSKKTPVSSGTSSCKKKSPTSLASKKTSSTATKTKSSGSKIGKMTKTSSKS